MECSLLWTILIKFIALRTTIGIWSLYFNYSGTLPYGHLSNQSLCYYGYFFWQRGKQPLKPSIIRSLVNTANFFWPILVTVLTGFHCNELTFSSHSVITMQGSNNGQSGQSVDNVQPR